MSQAEILDKAIATIDALANISDQLCDDCKQRIRQELRSQMLEGVGSLTNTDHSHSQAQVFLRTMTNNNLESRIKKRFSISDVASTNKDKLCHCHWSEAGKINLDVWAHESDCWIRKRLLTERFTVDTSVTPEKFTDGYALGVAFTQ